MPTFTRLRLRLRSPQAQRLWRYTKRIGVGLTGLAVVCAILWFWPTTDTLTGPRKAVLHSEIAGLELGVTASWYDLKLNSKTQQQTLDFSADGTATLPSYVLHTSLARLWLKRILMPRGLWTECENCYGPMAYVSLYRKNDYKSPVKTRLAQSAKVNGDVVDFIVSLIPDETQYEERPLAVDDLDALMAEAKAFVQGGPDNYIKPDTYGPAFKRLNPVRAEVYQGSVLIWMGDKIGYTLNPDSAGGPIVNAAWMTGTDFPGIQKIERILSENN